MKTIILGLVSTFFCFNLALSQDNIKISTATLNEFKAISIRTSKVISDIKSNESFKSNPESFEGKLRDAIVPLYPISKKVIAESGITSNEIPELQTFTDDQLVAVGTLIIGQQAIVGSNETTLSSVAECVGYAFLGVELHSSFWGSFTTRRAVIAAIGKIAAKYLGAIGVALITYDFVDCMGWI
jgi:hypothetical protein